MSANGYDAETNPEKLTRAPSRLRIDILNNTYYLCLERHHHKFNSKSSKIPLLDYLSGKINPNPLFSCHNHDLKKF